MNRLERQRREAGISTEKVNKMKSEIYEAMRKNGVTIIEAKVIIAELGRVISEVEKRSPNTRLSEIPTHQEEIKGFGGAPGPKHPIPCPPKSHFAKENEEGKKKAVPERQRFSYEPSIFIKIPKGQPFDDLLKQELEQVLQQNLEIISRQEKIFEKREENQGEIVRIDPEEVDKGEFGEEDLKRAEKMMLYAIAKNTETGHIEIHPMNNKGYIEIHGEEDAKFFTDRLMDSFRTE